MSAHSLLLEPALNRSVPVASVPRRTAVPATIGARLIVTLVAAPIAAIGLLLLAGAPAHAATCPGTLNHVMPRLQDEAPTNLCQFAGQVVLVVNTASYCGFTPQYEQLEALYARYAARGLTILGFPSNDFGQQEPGSKEQIAALCFNTYGVKFPMFAKTTVAGASAHPLYVTLARDSGQPPRWNFHKYLLDRNGRVVASFPSQIAPLDARLTARIEALLKEPAPGRP